MKKADKIISYVFSKEKTTGEAPFELSDSPKKSKKEKRSVTLKTNDCNPIIEGGRTFCIISHKMLP